MLIVNYILPFFHVVLYNYTKIYLIKTYIKIIKTIYSRLNYITDFIIN